MDDGELSFSGEIWYWRGPSPFHFVTVPEPQRTEIHEISREVTEFGSDTATVAAAP